MAVDPSGRFAYMPIGSLTTASSISAFAIDATTGTLTPLSANTFAAGADPETIVFDLTGKFVYVGNISSNNISAYTFNPTTGTLTPVPGSPFATAVLPIHIALAQIP